MHTETTENPTSPREAFIIDDDVVVGFMRDLAQRDLRDVVAVVNLATGQIVKAYYILPDGSREEVPFGEHAGDHSDDEKARVRRVIAERDSHNTVTTPATEVRDGGSHRGSSSCGSNSS